MNKYNSIYLRFKASPYKSVIQTQISNIFSKFLVTAFIFLGVYWIIPYLGVEKYGILITVTSFTAMVSFFDLGIGNALTNLIAGLEQSPERLRKVSGYIGLLIITSLFAVVSINLFFYIIPIQRVIKINGNGEDLKVLVILFSFVVAFTIIGNGITRLYLGLQKGYITYIASATGTLGAIMFLYVAKIFELDLLSIYSIYNLLPLFPIIFLLILMNKRKIINIRFLFLDWLKNLKDIYPISKHYLFIQIGVILSTGLDMLIISNRINVETVAVYSITLRIFQLISQPLMIANNPLWGTYAVAHAQNNINFIKKTLKTSLGITLLLSLIFSSLIAFYGNEIAEILTKGNISIPIRLLELVGIWTVIEAVGHAFAMYKNGCSIMKAQVIEVYSIIILSLPLKIILCDKIGIIAIPLVTIFSYVIVNIIVYLFLFKNEVINPIFECKS